MSPALHELWASPIWLVGQALFLALWKDYIPIPPILSGISFPSLGSFLHTHGLNSILQKTMCRSQSSVWCSAFTSGTLTENASCLGLPRLGSVTLMWRISWALPGFSSLGPPLESSSNNYAGSIKRLTSFVSYFSRITVPSLLDVQCFIYFSCFSVLFVFRQEGKSNPSYSILTEVEVYMYILHLCCSWDFSELRDVTQTNFPISSKVWV